MRKIFLSLCGVLCLQGLAAQNFDARLQIRPRAEFRNGFKTLLPENADPAFFISQRSRINLNYELEALRLRTSFQNVHIWGDIPSTGPTERNGIKFFEAYADYSVNPALSLRLGRQELSYDNQRIFGGLDWAQQGQSHDAFLVSLLPAANQRLDVGIAMNAEAEDLLRVPFTANTYKNMQFAWYRMNNRLGGLSFLFLNNGYEYPNHLTGSTDVQYLQTFGTFFRFTSSQFSGDLWGYGQTGERNDREVQAVDLGGNITYRLSQVWRTGVGAEYLSGTDADNLSGENRSFSPLFGTNHAFNGLMDYFYVGNHLNSVGLTDVYGNLTYAHQKLELSVSPHLFWSAAKIVDSGGEERESFLGTEIDFTGSFRLQRDIAISFGYSQMFGSQSMEILKGGDRHRTQNWAWIMVSFHPTLFTTGSESAR